MNAFLSTLSAQLLPSVGEIDLLLIPKGNGPNLLLLIHASPSLSAARQSSLSSSFLLVESYCITCYNFNFSNIEESSGP